MIAEIVAVNVRQSLVLDKAGNIGKITNFFDVDGEDSGHKEAVVCIAECCGKWHVIDLREFESVALN